MGWTWVAEDYGELLWHKIEQNRNFWSKRWRQVVARDVRGKIKTFLNKKCFKETTWNFFQTHLYHWNEQSRRTRRKNGMRTSNGLGIAFECPSQWTLQSNWLFTLQSRIDCWPKSSHPVVMKFRRERRKIRGKKKGENFWAILEFGMDICTAYTGGRKQGILTTGHCRGTHSLVCRYIE